LLTHRQTENKQTKTGKNITSLAEVGLIKLLSAGTLRATVEHGKPFSRSPYGGGVCRLRLLVRNFMNLASENGAFRCNFHTIPVAN